MGATTESTLGVQRSVIVICFVFILVALSPAQTKSSLSEHTFRNEDVGLTWTFPETLVPEAPDQFPRDPASRERIVLALWDKAQKTPVPLIVFLWDTRSRPDTRSPSAWALQYLADLRHRQSLSPGEGVKMSDPTKKNRWPDGVEDELLPPRSTPTAIHVCHHRADEGQDRTVHSDERTFRT
jgi:hypothetical protein